MTGFSRVAIIAAVASNGVIGHRNRMPWHLPEDLRRFRQLTLGHAVIMGRRTFESIGGPLAGRDNIVITRSPDWTRSGCRAVRSLDAALAAVVEPRDAFVIGGAQIYALAIPIASRLRLPRPVAHPERNSFALNHFAVRTRAQRRGIPLATVGREA